MRTDRQAGGSSLIPPNFVETLFVEAICQGLAFSVAKIGRLGRAVVFTRWRLRNLLHADGGVDRAIKAAVQGLADLGQQESDVDAGRIRSLLNAPEFEDVVRQMFAVGLGRTAGGKNKYVGGGESREKQLRGEFFGVFQREMGETSAAAEGVSDQAFDAIAESCGFAVRQLIESRELGAHEALSGARFALIRGELERIQQKLDTPSPDRPNLGEILDFEDRYRKSMQTVHRHIKPPHLLDEEQRVPIEELYVPPVLLVPDVTKEDSGEPVTLDLDEFMERAFRAVLLGNPGGGKSTFVQNLCVSLSADGGAPPYGGRSITPIRIILREYSKDRHENGMSIIEHIEKVMGYRYQVKPPPRAIEAMLEMGRAIVFFDGLDELLLTQHRRDIRTDVEAFCNLYPAAPVIATSRVVGYDQAPLDSGTFVEFRLGQFRREDVYLYGRRWFSLMGTPDGSKPEDRAERLVQETRDIVDLAANPLMLALICNLTRAMRELPQSRPKIFEACSEMLFRKWDDQRGFAPVLPFDAHVKPTLEYLANWIYTSEQRQAGVRRSELVDAAVDYLTPGRFSTRDEAVDAAEVFIAHCTGRAWVFSDTGSTEDGELLYEFTHRTFLEYYAAQYVVSWSDGIDEVADWLVPRVAGARSDEVTQQVMHILCDQREHARDRLLTRLMELVEGDDPAARWNAEHFIVRSLEFIVPSIAILDQVISSTVSRLIEWARLPYEDRRNGPDALAALGSAIRCSHENRPNVLSALHAALIMHLRQARSGDIGAFELAMGLDRVLQRTTMDSVVPQKLSADVMTIGWGAIDACREQIEQQAENNFFAARLCVSEEWRALDQLGQRFGVRAFFRSMSSVLFIQGGYESIAEMLVRDTEGTNDGYREDGLRSVGRRELSDWRRLKLLIEIGKRSRVAPRPWMYTTSSLRSSPLLRRDDVRLSPDAFFGAICLALPELEMKAGRDGSRLSVLSEVLGAEPEAFDALGPSGARSDNELFLREWAERRFTLIGEE